MSLWKLWSIIIRDCVTSGAAYTDDIHLNFGKSSGGNNRKTRTNGATTIIRRRKMGKLILSRLICSSVLQHVQTPSRIPLFPVGVFISNASSVKSCRSDSTSAGYSPPNCLAASRASSNSSTRASCVGKLGVKWDSSTSCMPTISAPSLHFSTSKFFGGGVLGWQGDCVNGSAGFVPASVALCACTSF